MRQYSNYSYQLVLCFAVLVAIFYAEDMQAQRRIKFVVYQQSTNIGDCDLIGDSDPYWWFWAGDH